MFAATPLSRTPRGGRPSFAARAIASLALAAATLLAAPAPAESDPFDLPSFNAAAMSEREIADATAKIEADGGWWVRIGDEVFAPAAAGPERAELVDRDPAHYYIAQGVSLPYLDLEMARVGGANGFHILHLPDGMPASLARFQAASRERLCRGFDGALRALPVNQTLLKKWRPSGQESARGGIVWGIPDPDVQALVDQVDQDRYFNEIAALALINTRNSQQPGNDTARDQLAAEFATFSPSLAVTTPSFSISGNPANNVVATLTGTMFPAEFVVVGAHYDSLPAFGAPAPGAEDNGSGTAAVLEMARIIAAAGPQQRTIHFIAFSGEEQGLVGSEDWANDLTPTQEANLRGAIIMDMVSYTATPAQTNAHVLLETDPASGGDLRTVMAQSAADFTGLNVFTSDFPFGSDHMPFINRNLPSVLAIENDWDVYPAYHQSTDTTANITRSQGAEIVRMNLAAAMRLANPAPVPVEVSGFELE